MRKRYSRFGGNPRAIFETILETELRTAIEKARFETLVAISASNESQDGLSHQLGVINVPHWREGMYLDIKQSAQSGIRNTSNARLAGDFQSFSVSFVSPEVGNEVLRRVAKVSRIQLASAVTYLDKKVSAHLPTSGDREVIHSS